MTAPADLESEPHFDHELERDLFAGMVLLLAVPPLALGAYLFATHVGMPKQILWGFSAGAGLAGAFSGAALLYWHSSTGRWLEAGLRALGLSSWGFPTAAAVLVAEGVYQRLHIEFLSEMLHWAEWMALGVLAALVACRAVLSYRRRRRAARGGQ